LCVWTEKMRDAWNGVRERGKGGGLTGINPALSIVS
jgi:hypothetical protein